MTLPKQKFRIGTKVIVKLVHVKGTIIGAHRHAGSLSYSYLVKYKYKSNGKFYEDWYTEKYLKKL